LGLPDLMHVLHHLPHVSDPNVLVGFEPADDAGVYKLSDRLAIILTTDFFPPIVDDPYTYGGIAAANALSDIYAMGGTPKTALNIVGFPKKDYPPKVLNAILRGGMDKVAEAGAAVIGGHTLEAPELFYGLAVSGTVHPLRIITCSRARPGDLLILTKPLGVGLVTTGIMGQCIPARRRKHALHAVCTSMLQLNRLASELMIRHCAHACTDVTGFGLLGHAHEMADASRVAIHINSTAIPSLPEALELARQGICTRVSRSNRAYLTRKVRFAPSVDPAMQQLLLEAETSGGLLIALAPRNAERLLAALHKRAITSARVIGKVMKGLRGRIRID
jgi:selenide,water dikinase